MRLRSFFILLPWAVGCYRSIAASNDPDSGREGQDDGTIVPLDAAVAGPGYIALLQEAKRELGAMRSTSYSHATIVDESTGVFDFDCSGFVDYALARAVPDAYRDLVARTVKRPVAASFVTFFQSLAVPIGRWRSVVRVRDLAQGDLVAWLEPPELKSTNTGHVMIVSEIPVERMPGEFTVLVIDSSTSRHGDDDTRLVAQGGLGSGRIVLLADPTSGGPWSYKWSTLASSVAYTTTIALAHLE
jgi:hypothetical protein